MGSLGYIYVLHKRISHMKREMGIDPLTGIPDRRFLETQAKRCVELAMRRKVSFACLAIDLDKFKMVNDTMGHQVGDEVLKDVAKKLQECCRETDYVARIGGDEFVLLALGENEEGLKILSKRIKENVEKVAKKHMIPSEYNFGVSVGISVYGENENHGFSGMFKSADDNLYAEKKLKDRRHR